jgi:hypothetical protein
MAYVVVVLIPIGDFVVGEQHWPGFPSHEAQG